MTDLIEKLRVCVDEDRSVPSMRHNAAERDQLAAALEAVLADHAAVRAVHAAVRARRKGVQDES